jgi:hypothetical protein
MTSSLGRILFLLTLAVGIFTSWFMQEMRPLWMSKLCHALVWFGAGIAFAHEIRLYARSLPQGLLQLIAENNGHHFSSPEEEKNQPGKPDRE